MPVEVVTLATKPVEQTTEFVGTVKSRRSATMQPQVEGFVTRIAVRRASGCAPGARADSRSTPRRSRSRGGDAAVAARRRARPRSRYARQQAARLKTLLEAGAGEPAELEQAETALATAEAQLKAAEEQIRAAARRTRLLQVSWRPAAGVVGDIPVRVGDRVTRVDRADHGRRKRRASRSTSACRCSRPRDLKVGLPVRLVDDAGRDRSPTQVTFVAPSVDDAHPDGAGQGGARVGPGRLPHRPVRPRAHRVDARAPG